MGSVVAPPAAAATLTASADDARDAVLSAVSAAQQALAVEGALAGTGLFGGGATARAGAGVSAAGSVRAMASGWLSCHDLFETDPCYGQAWFSTNMPLSAEDIPSGSYMSFRFEGIGTYLDGVSLSVDGGFRVDFLSRLESDPSRWTKEAMVIDFQGLVGGYGGIGFGPVTMGARIDIDTALGTLTTTIGGMRSTNLEFSTVGNATTIHGGTVRIAHPSRPQVHVDVAFAGWEVLGRPTAGSATVSAAADAPRLDVRVQATTPTGLIYRVDARQGGVVLASWEVIATYDADRPSYAVRAAGA